MRISITAFFTLAACICAAQGITVSASSGIGTYLMKDMKTFQSEIKEQFPFKPTVTDEFPPFVYYELGAVMQSGERFFFGTALSFGSTGGRVQYRDYSGYLRADQLLRYINISAAVGITLKASEKWNIQFDLRPTHTLTRTSIVFEQKVAALYEDERLKFRSQSWALQPGFIVNRKFNRFGIHVHASYYAVVKNGKMYLTEDDQLYLIDQNKNPLRPEWNGVRVALGANFKVR